MLIQAREGFQAGERVLGLGRAAAATEGLDPVSDQETDHCQDGDSGDEQSGGRLAVRVWVGHIPATLARLLVWFNDLGSG